jgi:hypothetical protein
VGIEAWYRRRGDARIAAGDGPATSVAARLGKALLVALPVTIVAATWQGSLAERGALADLNNAVLNRVAEGDGILLTGGTLDLVQLKTRRPVLLNGGGLDGLAYAPDSGPAIDRILREVYAIDFFDPPETARRRGAIPNAFNREAWEKFPGEKWQQIRQAYGVTEVLTPGDWQLPLAVVARDGSYALYRLP